MTSVFDQTDVTEMINRIDNLKPSSKPLWGKMTVAQMLAHCNVSYELVYENKHPKPNAFTKILLKLFLKNLIVKNTKPYKKSLQTAPAFLIKEDKNFDEEKTRLINHIKKTQELGGNYFDGKESHSFGRLTKHEWDVMFYKHLHHHLKQFGV
ncbi:MAG TPA: DUF1569 domain-containing protein [Ferruginibacter sp.]|jgi:hypothetical protein|nr:DUF1569 domain-containing protein [Ferruginibacter sp.]